MSRPSPFDYAFWSLVRGHNHEPHAQRGYKVVDGDFFIDGHLIAQRKYGKVRMFLTEPRFFRYAIANAIKKVREEAEERGLLLRVCGEHEDCRAHEELGVACWNDRNPALVTETAPPARDAKGGGR